MKFEVGKHKFIVCLSVQEDCKFHMEVWFQWKPKVLEIFWDLEVRSVAPFLFGINKMVKEGGFSTCTIRPVRHLAWLLIKSRSTLQRILLHADNTGTSHEILTLVHTSHRLVVQVEEYVQQTRLLSALTVIYWHLDWSSSLWCSKQLLRPGTLWQTNILTLKGNTEAFAFDKWLLMWIWLFSARTVVWPFMDVKRCSFDIFSRQTNCNCQFC